MKIIDTDSPFIRQSRLFRAFPVILIFLSWLLLAFFFVRYVEDYANAFQRSSFLSRVRILSSALDVGDIHSLTGRVEDVTKPSYQHLKAQLSRVVQANSKLRFAYLLRNIDGKIVFLIDNEPEHSKDYSPPGQVYEEASPELQRLFEQGEGLVEGPLLDRWGKWVSALVPVKDMATGQTLAVMGLDMDSSLWESELAIYRTFAVSMAVFLFFIIFISLFFLNRQRWILQKLARGQERFRHVADSSGDWIWETDLSGLYTYSSYAIKNILGYEPHEVIGKKYFYDFCFSDELERIKSESEKFIKEGKLFIREIARRQHKDGREVLLDVHGFAIRTSRGRIIGYRGVDRDITDMKRNEKAMEENRQALEKANRDLEINEKVLLQMLKDMESTNKELKETQNQLIQSEKMATVGILASGVAHEIKNPLAIISQGMERIEKILMKTAEGGSEYVTMVKNAAVRANKVVNALLKFSRSSHLEAAPLDIREVIDSAITLIESRTQASKIDIVREYKSAHHMVSGDSITLEQVFFDLFTNAIDAMPDGGKIFIATQFQKASEESGLEAKLVVEVRDTGSGISPENLPHIFDPFFTTKDPDKGTGLGLSTVYLILERHKGSIKAESTVGVGTVFYITLPVLSKKGQARHGR